MPPPRGIDDMDERQARIVAGAISKTLRDRIDAELAQSPYVHVVKIKGPSMVQRLVKAMVLTSLAVIMGSLALVGYWLFWPVTPYSAENINLQLTSTTATEGGTISYWIEGTHNTKGVTVDVYTQLIVSEAAQIQSQARGVGGVLTQYTPRRYLTVPGYHRLLITQPVPQILPPGMYRIISFTTFHINPLRDITIRRDTPDFEVIAALKS